MTERSKLNGLVLRAKPYRETSLMVDLFTRELGRVSGVRKGYRTRKGHNAIQPFVVAVVATSGSDGLLNIYEFDASKNLAPQAADNAGPRMAAGFYVLELIFRALRERQVESELFDLVLAVLSLLQEGAPEKPLLRQLERRLLDRLGYGIDFSHAQAAQEAQDTERDMIEIQSEDMDKRYQFVSGYGFVSTHEGKKGLVFSGHDIVAIQAENYENPRVASLARQLYQAALVPLIGEQPLESRKLLNPELQDFGV